MNIEVFVYLLFFSATLYSATIFVDLGVVKESERNTNGLYIGGDSVFHVLNLVTFVLTGIHTFEDGDDAMKAIWVVALLIWLASLGMWMYEVIAKSINLTSIRDQKCVT
jgi:hypothetical protein